MSAKILWEEDPLYFIFNESVPGKTKMHTHPLDMNDWVKIDRSYIDQMKLRRKLWQDKQDLVYVSNTDASAEACKWEFFKTLVDYLPNRYPQIFELRENTIYNKALNESVSTERNDSQCPLIRAGLLTQEDWCLIEWNEAENEYVLTSGILYFPMRWSLREKFNKGIAAIHVPVKAFTKYLQPKVYDVFKKMKPENPLWRANWAIFNDLDGPLDLYTPTGSLDRNEVNKTTVFDCDKTGKELTFRAEYQTLVKLPETQCIVFGIRTYQRYLEEFKHYPESDCEGLIKAIESLDPDFKEYKGSEYWQDAAKKYLKYATKSRAGNQLSFGPQSWLLSVALVFGLSVVGGIMLSRYRNV